MGSLFIYELVQIDSLSSLASHCDVIAKKCHSSILLVRVGEGGVCVAVLSKGVAWSGWTMFSVANFLAASGMPKSLQSLHFWQGFEGKQEHAGAC